LADDKKQMENKDIDDLDEFMKEYFLPSSSETQQVALIETGRYFIY